MAKMYPSRLSDRVLNDRKLRGEIETFNALSKLPDEFEVFYNRVPNDGSSGHVFQRVIDFIIIHEQLGLLAMEVKGGKIRLNDQGGFEQYQYVQGWAPCDPHKQVKLGLLSFIKTVQNDNPQFRVPDNFCVLFPDAFRYDLTDTPQTLPAGTLCAEDLPTLSILVPTLFPKNRKSPAWPRDTFIDVRRRLQTMPQARDTNDTIESRPNPKTPPRSRYSVKRVWDSKNEQPLGEIKRKKQKPPINYRPTRPYASRRSKLEWWEVIILAAMAIMTFVFVSWLFPSSFIHQFF